MSEISRVRARKGVRRLFDTALIATPQDLAAGLLVALIFIETTALGVNEELLQSFASAANLGLTIFILNYLRAENALWKSIAIPFLLLGLALLWVCLPSFADTYDFWSMMPGYRPSRPVPDLQFGAGIRYLGQSALLLCAVLIGFRKGSVRSLVDWIILFGLANLIIGLFLRWIDPQHVWGLPKVMHEFRFTGTFQNANVAGSLFGFLALLALGRILATAGYSGLWRTNAMRGWMVVYGLTLLSALGATIITGSRTSIALTLLGGILLILLPKMKGLSKTVVFSIFIGAMLAVAGVFVIGSMLQFAPLQRIGQIGPDSVYRGEIYARYWHLFLASPLYGYGLASFSEVNLLTLTSASQARAFSYINAAHNHILQLLLTGGWPFVLMQLAAIAIIVRKALTRNPLEDPGMMSIWIGMLVILGCSMIDIALTVPSILSLVIAVLGIMWGRAIRLKIEEEAKANDPKTYYSRRRKMRVEENEADAAQPHLA